MTLLEKIEAWLLEPGLTRHSDIRAFAKKIDEEYELVEKSPELEALKRYKKSVEPEVGKSECEDGLCVGGGGVICKKHFQQAYEKLWEPEVEKKEVSIAPDATITLHDHEFKHVCCQPQPNELPEIKELGATKGYRIDDHDVASLSSFMDLKEVVHKILTVLRASKECNTKE